MSDKTVTGALPLGALVLSDKNRYRVEKVLGQGGFGITYLVTRMSDGRRLAMKEFFRKQLCMRESSGAITFFPTNREVIEEGIEDFITEANRLKKVNISHPNIVSVEDVFRTNATAYYIMEYIQGDDLMRFMTSRKHKPLSTAQALSVMRPLLQAMALLHEGHITHLDIKPENVILTYLRDGAVRPVIIDFGMAKHYDKKGKATSSLSSAGFTDGFAPVEQYQGLHTFTPQADVYALGAMLLYLLSAKWPPKSSEITPQKILSLLPEGVPENIQNALINAMRLDKAARTQSVAIFAGELGVDISEADDSDAHETHLLGQRKQKRAKKEIDLKPYVKPAAIVCGVILVAALMIFGFRSCGGGATPADLDNDTIPLIPEEDSVAVVTEELENPSSEAVTPKPETQPEQPARPTPSAQQPAQQSQQQGQQAHAQETQPQANNLDAQFASAKTYSDYVALANKGYTKAYSRAARLALQNRNYDAANSWLRKAKASGVGVSEAKSVAADLSATGYYDNGENGGNPF